MEKAEYSEYILSDKLYDYAYVHLLPELQIGLHEHEAWELSYIIKGEGTRLMGQTTSPFTCGDLVLVPPSMPHCWYFDSKCTDHRGRITNITLMFSTSLLEQLVRLFPAMKDVVDNIMSREDALTFGQSRAGIIVDKLVAMNDASDPQRLPMLLDVLINLGSDEVSTVGKYEKPDRVADRIKMVKLYVSCNYNRDVTLADVADFVSMNRASFSTFFKKSVGMGFVDYLNKFRVERAQELLREGKSSIAEVGYSVGFSSASYFNRVFKKFTGQAPSQYVSSQE